MQYSDFEKQIDRLKIVYSAASLNAERIRVLWDRFKVDRADIFEKVVTHMIAEFTTQQLPALSRFVEAKGMFRTNLDGASFMQALSSPFQCDACRDFGFGFVGDMVTSCSCDLGRRISPAELAKQQSFYNAGGEFLKRGRMRNAFLAELPYDPKERIGNDECIV